MSVLSRAMRAYSSLPRSVQGFLPFLMFMVGGSFALREFAQLRYEFRKTKQLDPETLKAEGLMMSRPSETTLESVYEEIKELDVDNWENIRGPRPYEEDSGETLAAMKAKAAARRKEAEEAKMARIRNG